MIHEQTGPYLTAAVFCERILQEKDGSLSIIRIVDRSTLSVTLDPGVSLFSEEVPHVPLTLMALVAFRGAEAGDTLDLRLEIEGPDGQRAEGIPPTPLYVAPGEEGANAVINLTLRIRQEGIYLMHVLLGEREFTRVPLRVEVQEQRPPPEQSELTQ